MGVALGALGTADWQPVVAAMLVNPIAATATSRTIPWMHERAADD
jgi:hypothetical protein